MCVINAPPWNGMCQPSKWEGCVKETLGCFYTHRHEKKALHSTFDFYIDNLNVELGRQFCTRHSIFTKIIWMLCWAASSALDIRFLHNLNVVLGRQLCTRHSIFLKTIWMMSWAASSALDIRFLQRQSECCAGPSALHSTFDFLKDNLIVELGR